MFWRSVGLGVALTVSSAVATADDWLFDDGPYTRNPQTGQRVEQYEKPKDPVPVPYEKYFSEDGPHPYIPWWYYYDELGGPGMGYGLGGWGGGGIPYGGASGGLPSYGFTF